VKAFKTLEVNSSLKELNLTNIKLLTEKQFNKLFKFLMNYESLEILSLQGSNLNCNLMLILLTMMKKKKFKKLTKVNFFGIQIKESHTEIYRLIHDLIVNENCSIIISSDSTIATYLSTLMESNEFGFCVKGIHFFVLFSQEKKVKLTMFHFYLNLFVLITSKI
jgi:hypothetical protein